MLHYHFLTGYMLNRDWDCHANECAHQATHAAASAKRSALSSSSGITTQSKNHEFSNVFDRVWFSICIWNLNSNWYQKILGTTVHGNFTRCGSLWIGGCPIFLKPLPAERSARAWGQTTIGLTVWFQFWMQQVPGNLSPPLIKMPGHQTSVGCDFKPWPGALACDWILSVSHSQLTHCSSIKQALGLDLDLTVFAPQCMLRHQPYWAILILYINIVLQYILYGLYFFAMWGFGCQTRRTMIYLCILCFLTS